MTPPSLLLKISVILNNTLSSGLPFEKDYLLKSPKRRAFQRKKKAVKREFFFNATDNFSHVV